MGAHPPSTAQDSNPKGPAFFNVIVIQLLGKTAADRRNVTIERSKENEKSW